MPLPSKKSHGFSTHGRSDPLMSGLPSLKTTGDRLPPHQVKVEASKDTRGRSASMMFRCLGCRSVHIQETPPMKSAEP
jgi:hypothetical protein